MFGLTISDPQKDTARRTSLSALLYALDLPLAEFTERAAPLFSPCMSPNAFLRTASAAVLIPGEPLPMDALLSCLSGRNPLPANVLRRHLFLQWSLTPYLRAAHDMQKLNGAFLLGDALLIIPVSEEDIVDLQLPPGVWTELNGSCHQGCLRSLRGWNETPVLFRQNTLLPVSINGQSLTQTTDDDTDRLTLHWFQPTGASACTLADGTCYHAQRVGEQFCIQTNTSKPFHLIVHQDGTEHLIR